MLKSLLKDTVVYGISKYLGVFAAIFLMPIYTRLLTKGDYGVMEIINSWNNFIIMLIPLGLTSSIIRFYADIKDNQTERKEYLGTINITLIIISVLYTIIMIVAKPFFIPFFDQFEGMHEIYYHSIFIAVATIFIGHFLTLLQVQFKKVNYLLVSVINLFILVILGFVFVYSFQMGVVGFFRASSIANLITLTFCFWFTRSDFSILFVNKTFKKILKYSIHILSVGILFSLVNLLDRYIIAEFGNIQEVGLYSIGVRISGIMGLAVASFSLAWFPIAMNMKDEENAKNTYSRVHDFYFIVSTILLVSLFLFRKELIVIFAPDYMEAYNVIGILGAQLIINGTIYFYSLGIHINKKTKYISYSGIVSILINVVLSILLVRNYGINGVAIGTLVGSIVWVIIQFFYSQKELHIPFKFKTVITSLILCTVTYLCAPYLDELFMISIAVSILVKGLIVLLLSLGLFALFLGKSGVNDILRILKSKITKTEKH